MPGATILIIDDEPAMRALVGAVVTGAGHEVVDAESGEAGLDLLMTRHFDLLITDKNLPGIDGIEVLRRARQKLPDLYAILMTAQPSEQSRQEAFKLGVYRYFTKPFDDLDDLAATVNMAIREGRATATLRKDTTS